MPTSSDTPACPDPELVLSLVSGRRLLPGDLPVLWHLAGCQECQSALAFTAAAVNWSAATRQSAREGVWTETAVRRLAQRLAFWKRCLERGTDAVAAGTDSDGRLLFRSAEDAPPDRAWKAQLVFSPSMDSSAPFALEMLPVDGHTAMMGHFVLFGVSVPVTDGTAAFPPDILARAANADSPGGVSFIAQDGVETAGVPILDIPG